MNENIKEFAHCLASVKLRCAFGDSESKDPSLCISNLIENYNITAAEFVNIEKQVKYYIDMMTKIANPEITRYFKTGSPKVDGIGVTDSASCVLVTDSDIKVIGCRFGKEDAASRSLYSLAFDTLHQLAESSEDIKTVSIGIYRNKRIKSRTYDRDLFEHRMELLNQQRAGDGNNENDH